MTCSLDRFLKGLTLSQLPCHLLQGSSHLSIKDRLIMKYIWWSNLIMSASWPAVMTWRSRHAGCSLQWWMLLFRLWWPSQIPVSPPIPITGLNHGGSMCALTCPFVEVHVYVRSPANVAGWSHSPRSPPPSWGGNKNNLAKRAVHIHMHSCTQASPSDTKARQLAWRSWTVLLYTHAHIHTLRLQFSWTSLPSLCIRTNSVSPPLGCGCRTKQFV